MKRKDKGNTDVTVSVEKLTEVMRALWNNTLGDEITRMQSIVIAQEGEIGSLNRRVGALDEKVRRAEMQRLNHVDRLELMEARLAGFNFAPAEAQEGPTTGESR